ncbi:MAG TPA: ribosomal protein S18-alanine N-acetyltransferase [Candidatus Angelobacter sp.]|nr:ribosomal protein S18-alanine N-acetyltransferase [Candidatus Angelobacter sp.]
MSTVRVRPAEPADLPRLMEIASHSATAAGWNEQQYTRLFSPEASRNQVTLVIQQDGKVVGFLAARQVAGSEWEIENVAVSGPARRRGLGSHLLGSFLDLVRSRGGIEIYLEVRESNHAARALYEKWAFQEAGRRKSYYREPDEDALVLRFSFPQQG